MSQYIDERGDVVSSDETNKVEHVTATEARQGFLGRPVLMVLGVSLFLAAVAWAGAEMWAERTDNDAATQLQTETATDPDTVTGSVDKQPSTETKQTAPIDQDPTPETGTDTGN
ncbi:hypothetical protein [Pararhizobium sp.]|uniref:hypothetical protein n=1 Tax=Pararhizobium sp. TaxID=1977563 RepID=UPI002715956F|nr:hypothetical protein [Pararhizobium sp.]MDO9416362.1 hypothetical protein [Pararhizobium sp.]